MTILLQKCEFVWMAECDRCRERLNFSVMTWVTGGARCFIIVLVELYQKKKTKSKKDNAIENYRSRNLTIFHTSSLNYIKVQHLTR